MSCEHTRTDRVLNPEGKDGLVFAEWCRTCGAIRDSYGTNGWGQWRFPGTPAASGTSLEMMPIPIPMRLPCPSCGKLHVDKGIFAARHHTTHACQHCGAVWRPAIVPTVGVEFLPGFKDEPLAAGDVAKDEILRLLGIVESYSQILCELVGTAKREHVVVACKACGLDWTPGHACYKRDAAPPEGDR